MIDVKLLLLRISDQSDHPLNRYPGVDLSCSYDFRNWELGLRAICRSVSVYDFYRGIAQKGIVDMNREIVDTVRKEQIDILLWPTTFYEIREETFQEVRALGCLVVGCFFDDSMRFDDLTRFYLPHIDYALTFESSSSVEKYRAVGADAMFLPNVPSRSLYQPYQDRLFCRDIAFVGARIADREQHINAFRNARLSVETFGRGWNNGYISTERAIEVYQTSKINLNFVKPAHETGNMQLKGRIFEICMCGGFLLTENIEGITDYFEPDRDIVTFSTIEEGVDKARFYITHEKSRARIAHSGLQRARRDYCFESVWPGIIDSIVSGRAPSLPDSTVPVSKDANLGRASWHRSMACGFYLEGDAGPAAEQLSLAVLHGGKSKLSVLMAFCMKLPGPIGRRLFNLANVVGRKRARLVKSPHCE